MTEKTVVLKIENTNFAIKLYQDFLKIDLKGNLKNEIEEAIANKPILKESIGKIFGIFVPLHIRIDEIEYVNMDETGKTTLTLTHNRDVVLPFENKEDAKRLIEKLDQMISSAKDRKRAKIELNKIRSRAERKRIRKRPRAERRV